MNSKISTSLGLDWLIRLRWLAAAGQLALVLCTIWILKLELPLLPLLFLISLLAASNLLLHISKAKRMQVPSSALGAVLVFDTLLLTLLLYWTGGPYNPFSVLYLVQIALAAVMLGTSWTWLLVAFSSLSFGLLFRYHIPLEIISHGPHHSMAEHGDHTLSLHLHGMFVAFVFTASLIAYFVTELSRRLRAKEAELHELQLRRVNAQRLASLATMSAGAAHELSTPLSTIAIVANEFERDLSLLENLPTHFLEDAKLIKSEVGRCKEILNQMGAKSGNLCGELPREVAVDALFNAVKRKLPQHNQRLHFETKLQDDVLLAPQNGLTQTLAALIRNALDATSNNFPVQVVVTEKDEFIRFVISDSGSGMSTDTLRRLGEPFFSTKEAGKGMGLGFYLAKLFVENWGGEIEVSSALGKGTSIVLSLPNAYPNVETIPVAAIG